MATDPNNPPADGGGNGEDQQQTPEQKAAALAAKTADDASKARLMGKKAVDELKSVKAELDGLKAIIGESPEELKQLLAERREAKAKADNAKDEGKSATVENAEVKRLEREIEDIKRQAAAKEKVLEQKERDALEKIRVKAHRSALQEIVSESGVLEPSAAVELLIGKTKWDEATETLLVNVKNEDGEEETITLKGKDTLKKTGLLPNLFFPAEGAAGTGSGAPRGGGRGFDLDKALTSTQANFVADRERIRAELKRQRGGT
ncbi:MAG TPA: hypothetical protein VLC10_03935 [Patescibacteria group bacterium]|nr:hypothetical protein [Patescibacteria group bacterium]